MATEVIKNLTPEEREFKKKQMELSALESKLIQREIELVTLRAELSDFESRYLRTVGVLYAQLDEIEAEIAEAPARLKPTDTHAQEHAAHAGAQAQESSETGTTITEPTPKPTEEVRKAFLDHLHTLVDYWSKHRPDSKDACDGLVFSILNIFDGTTTMGLPAMDIVLRPHEGKESENWYQEGMVINDCHLHDEWFK